MNLTEAGESLVEVYRRRMLLMSVGELHPVRRRIDHAGQVSLLGKSFRARIGWLAAAGILRTLQ
jgi:hypothetical protein